MKKRRPTIFDLVKYTGISRGTISRAFNNQPGIKAQTRETILKSAREIGYIPHSGARMMKSGRTRRWGLLLPHLRNPYYSEMVDALNTRAQEMGTMILLGLSNYDAAREVDLIMNWTAGETDGLILDQAHYHTNPALFHRLKSLEVPMVFLHGAPIPGFDTVRYHLFDSFARVLTQLEAMGHTRIGYVGQKFPRCRETSRFRAYEEFHTARVRALDESLIVFGQDGAEGGINAWRIWMAAGSVPTAVVCCDDIVACGLVQAARASGRRVPKDISVSGVDDIAEAARLGLTTIRTNREKTAAAILDLLQMRRADFARPPEVREIPSELIMRDSIGRPWEG